jgi:hypothetical protein
MATLTPLERYLTEQRIRLCEAVLTLGREQIRIRKFRALHSRCEASLLMIEQADRIVSDVEKALDIRELRKLMAETCEVA